MTYWSHKEIFNLEHRKTVLCILKVLNEKQEAELMDAIYDVLLTVVKGIKK